MIRYAVSILTLWHIGVATASQDPPTPGKDYQSLQIASSTQAEDLQALFDQNRDLPFLRIERRGAQFTLRAGFWNTPEEARQALSGRQRPGAQLRIAVLRPAAILRSNWSLDTTDVAQERTSGATEPPSLPRFDSKTSGWDSPQVQAEPPRAPLRNLNPQDMELAYGVFLSSGDIRSALQIAEAAVKLLPSNKDWRRRLAKAAEWHQQPRVAAQQWAFLFQAGARDAETISNVTRLAWQLEELDVPLAAWRIVAQRRALSQQEALEVYKIFEEAARPKDGALFFEEQYARRRDIYDLEFASRLAVDARDDPLSLRLQLARSQMEPFSLKAVLGVVTLYIRNNRLQDALEFMRRHETRVPKEAEQFWQVLGEVAWSLQELDTARRAYGNFLQNKNADSSDWERLVFLTRDREPEAAAQLACEGYRRFGNMTLLVQGLEAYANTSNWPRMGEALGLPKGAALVEAEKSSPFLLLRARYAQGIHRPDEAWNDLRRALALDSKSKDVGLSALWFLIEQQRETELRALVRFYAQGDIDPDYWMAIATGHLVLNEPKQALLWLRRAITRQPENPILLLNYADALERNQQSGLARQMQRRAWFMLKEQFKPERSDQGVRKPELEWRTLLRLSLLNRPGDPALAHVRAWARELKVLPADASPSETTELVLAWAISREQFVNARAWMMNRYRQLAQAPVWARAQVALQTDNVAEMEELLQTQSTALGVHMRYDMERELGMEQQAMSTAFEGLARNPIDEALHDRFRQHAPSQAGYLESTFSTERNNSLSARDWGFSGHWPVKPGLAFTGAWSQSHQNAKEAPLRALRDIRADRPQFGKLGLDWRERGHEWHIAVVKRLGSLPQTGLQLRHALSPGRGLRWSNKFELGVTSEVSPAMRLAGSEDTVSSSLGWQFNKRMAFAMTPTFQRFRGAFDEDLGHSKWISFDAEYRLRLSYPDVRVRANLRRQVFAREQALTGGSLARYPASFQQALTDIGSTPGQYFLPESRTAWGLCLGMGENLNGQSLRDGFSRAWRPFGNLCLQHDAISGNGYVSEFGLAGSLLGGDVLRVEFQHGNGLANRKGPSSTFSLRYRDYF